MKRKSIFLFASGLFFLLANNSDVFGECSKEKANKLLKTAFKFYSNQDVNANIYSVDELKELGLCEVVFSITPNTALNTDQPVFKNIFYFKNDYLLFGELKKVGEGKVFDITREKIQTLNKEFFAYMEKQRAQADSAEREEIIKEVLEKFEDIKKMADMKFGTDGDIKAETITFTDPYCPHCNTMKQVLLEKVKEGKIRAYFIFLPLLGEESKKVVASIICDKKTDTEKLKAFEDKYVSKTKICSAGEKKIEENMSLFLKLKGTGVPLTILKREGSIRIIRGAVPKDVFENYLK
ncbi:MAG: thioredoxin fold domain-containing protein [Brevinematia bacterium]